VSVPVNTSATITNLQTERRIADGREYALLVAVWFLYLFAPAKLIQYYVPSARPLTWLPELLLWVCAINWLRSPAPKRGSPAYTRFLAVVILGVGVAFFLTNWGVARLTVRTFYQYYLLGLITFTFCSTPARAKRLLSLYFGYFAWYGLWGLISLKTSPPTADFNPGGRSMVAWHTDLVNRDAFGPLMLAGLGYSIYYLQATRAVRTRTQKVYGPVGIGLCAIGLVTSFSRGAFVGLIAIATSMWLRSQKKIAALVAAALFVGAFWFMAPQLTAQYLTAMQTIMGEGMESGTGADRADLWGLAWRDFLSSPIFGVGTNNYSIGASMRVLSEGERTPMGRTKGRIWGRAVHCAPMQILAENGLLGVVVAALLVIDFFRTNRRIRIIAAKQSDSATNDPGGGFPPGYLKAAALGLHAAFVALCISSVFYELLYTSLLWFVLVLNRMLYFSSGADADFGRKPA